MNLITELFLAALALSLVLQIWLDRRQIRHVLTHRDAVPEPFRDQIPLEAHRKAADYTVARTRLGMWERAYGSLLLLGWTLGGGLEWLDQTWRGLGLSTLATGVGVILSVLVIGSLLELPFALYRTFRLEARFGFNRTTPGTFVSDLVKQFLLTLIIGAPLIALVLWLMESAGPHWWLYVWAVWIGFSLLMQWAWPAFIAPLFNKFEPLQDESLRQRIVHLLERCGFRSSGVFVMDGSRRSSHGNAYFSGLGRNKRIVFYDTLLKSLTPEEVEAVLAHELGHFRRHHIRKRIVLMALLSLAGLWILAQLLQMPEFYQGLGVSTPSTYMGLILFMMVAPLFGVFLSPILAGLSRRHEFEADDFAASQADPRTLIHALVKLYEENASTLTPDPVYSAFHDSHPPAPVRIAHLSRKLKEQPQPA